MSRDQHPRAEAGQQQSGHPGAGHPEPAAPADHPLALPADVAALDAPEPVGPATTPGPGAVLPERHPKAIAPGQPIPSHFRNCFGCGQDHPTGLHLSPVAGPGLDIWARLLLTADHQGAAQLGHGGILAAITDEAMGALHWALRVPAVTARLEVDYLAPVPIGLTLVLRARITGIVGRKVYTAAVVGAGGRAVLRASGIFVQVPSSHFRGYDPGQDADIDRLELNP